MMKKLLFTLLALLVLGGGSIEAGEIAESSATMRSGLGQKAYRIKAHWEGNNTDLPMVIDGNSIKTGASADAESAIFVVMDNTDLYYRVYTAAGNAFNSSKNAAPTNNPTAVAFFETGRSNSVTWVVYNNIVKASAANSLTLTVKTTNQAFDQYTKDNSKYYDQGSQTYNGSNYTTDFILDEATDYDVYKLVVTGVAANFTYSGSDCLTTAAQSNGGFFVYTSGTTPQESDFQYASERIAINSFDVDASTKTITIDASAKIDISLSTDSDPHYYQIQSVANNSNYWMPTTFPTNVESKRGLFQFFAGDNGMVYIYEAGSEKWLNWNGTGAGANKLKWVDTKAQAGQWVLSFVGDATAAPYLIKPSANTAVGANWYGGLSQSPYRIGTDAEINTIGFWTNLTTDNGTKWNLVAVGEDIDTKIANSRAAFYAALKTDIEPKVTAALTANPDGTKIGMPVLSEVEKLRTASQTTGTDEEVYNALTLALDAYNTTPGKDLYLPTGYYYMKNMDGARYAINDYFREANPNHRTITSASKVVANNGIWRIERLENGKINITNGDGRGITRDAGMFNQLTIGQFNAAQYAQWGGGIYFTEGMHFANGAYYKIDDGNYFVTGWAHSDSKGSHWTFEPVPASNVYDFTIVDGNEDSYVTVDATGEKVFNGGFVFRSGMLGTYKADNENAPEGKYAYEETNQSTKHITVTYKDEPTQDEIDLLTLRIRNLLGGEFGIGYPDWVAAQKAGDGELLQALTNLVPLAHLEDTHIEVGQYYEFLHEYNIILNTDYVKLPEDGKFYTFKGTESAKYLTATATGLTEGTSAAGQDAVFYVEKLENGKYRLTSMLNGRVAKSTGLAEVGASGEFEIGSAHKESDGSKLFGQCHLKQEDGYVICSWNHGGIQGPNEKKTSNDWGGWTIVEMKNLPVNSNAVNGTYYSSFYSPVAVELPAGVNAYVAKANGTTLQLTQLAGNVLAANTPVILTSDQTIPNLPISDEAGEPVADDDNDLQGTVQAISQVEGQTYYVLNNGSKGAAFYKYNASKPLNGFRAYYTPQASSEVAAFTFGIEDIETAISAIESDNSQAEIYDLNGRRVKRATKGVFIVNGKKVMYK